MRLLYQLDNHKFVIILNVETLKSAKQTKHS